MGIAQQCDPRPCWFDPYRVYHARLAHLDLALAQIAVIHEQGELLGRTQAGKESKLIIVAVCLTPIAMDGGDERFGLVNRKRTDDPSYSFENILERRLDCASRDGPGSVCLGCPNLYKRAHRRTKSQYSPTATSSRYPDGAPTHVIAPSMNW